jgi:hypothetical protein
LVHEPSCTKWPPAWLSPALTVRPAAKPALPEPAADVSPWDLPPDLYERWEERVCIMHFDGRLPWRDAEALALADVLRHAGPAAANAKRDAGPKAGTAKAVVHAVLFASEAGPYSEGF